MSRGFFQRRSALPLISLVGGILQIATVWSYAEIDGTPLFKEMGARFNELTEQHHRHPGWEEAREFFYDTEGAPGEDLLFLLGEMDPLFDLLEQAAAADFFSHPPPEAYLPEKTIPEVNEARQFAAFIWAKIHILEEQGEVQEAQDLLWQFRHVFLQSMTPGTTIKFLTYSVTQRERHAQIYRLLAAQRRGENLTAQKSFVEKHPTFLEWLKPEKWFQLNTVDLLFQEDVRAEIDRLKNELSHSLEEDQNEREAVRKLIEKNKIFNVDRWAESIRATIRKFHEELAPALEGSREDYRQWRDALSEHWRSLHGLEDYTELAYWINRLVNESLSDGDLSEKKLLEIDARLKKALKGVYLGIIMIPYEMQDNLHRMLLASERLLAIELAADLYKESHGQRPEKLEQLEDENLLGPDHLTDPFSGEFFRLRTEPFWQPYSIGVNREDNGGIYLDWQDSRRGEEGDLLLFPWTQRED
ncbi:MAG: hypothetical protein JJT75_00345 [Opitutales bacterium]|nr:hypothetical protein [Opitutales bacterium]MCH8541304.1 hypothetical protein [Opitutales bacterium]